MFLWIKSRECVLISEVLCRFPYKNKANLQGVDETPTAGSDKSSIYEKSSNPKTGDNITNYMIMMFLSLVGIIGIKLYKRN